MKILCHIFYPTNSDFVLIIHTSLILIVCIVHIFQWFPVILLPAVFFFPPFFLEKLTRFFCNDLLYTHVLFWLIPIEIPFYCLMALFFYIDLLSVVIPVLCCNSCLIYYWQVIGWFHQQNTKQVMLWSLQTHFTVCLGKIIPKGDKITFYGTNTMFIFDTIVQGDCRFFIQWFLRLHLPWIFHLDSSWIWEIMEETFWICGKPHIEYLASTLVTYVKS